MLTDSGDALLGTLSALVAHLSPDQVVLSLAALS